MLFLPIYSLFLTAPLFFLLLFFWWTHLNPPTSMWLSQSHFLLDLLLLFHSRTNLPIWNGHPCSPTIPCLQTNPLAKRNTQCAKCNTQIANLNVGIQKPKLKIKTETRNSKSKTHNSPDYTIWNDAHANIEMLPRINRRNPTSSASLSAAGKSIPLHRSSISPTKQLWQLLVEPYRRRLPSLIIYSSQKSWKALFKDLRGPRRPRFTNRFTTGVVTWGTTRARKKISTRKR